MGSSAPSDEAELRSSIGQVECLRNRLESFCRDPCAGQPRDAKKAMVVWLSANMNPGRCSTDPLHLLHRGAVLGRLMQCQGPWTGSRVANLHSYAPGHRSRLPVKPREQTQPQAPPTSRLREEVVALISSFCRHPDIVWNS